MTINTSYLAKSSTDPNAVLVSCICPKWYKGKWIKALGPDWDTLKAYKDNGDWETYKKDYIAKLDRMGFDKVISLLNDGDILLCYEKDRDRCHRSLLADWLKDHGVTIGKEL